MVRRYFLDRSGIELSEDLKAGLDGDDWHPGFNIGQEQVAPVVRLHPKTGERVISRLSWSYPIKFGPRGYPSETLINVRAERIGSSSSTARAMESRRCLVPFSGYYEFHGDGIKALAARSERQLDGVPAVRPGHYPLMCMAGVWTTWKPKDQDTVIKNFMVITKDALEGYEEIHERAPAIIAPGDYAGWLGEDKTDFGDLLAMLRAPSLTELKIWRVGKEVGNQKNDGPDLLNEV